MIAPMCGRFVQAAKKEKWKERFGVELPSAASLKPRYNLAPGQPAGVITDSGRKLVFDSCVWGLIPSWTKDPNTAFKMINARVESVWEKKTFRDSLRYRRCLVPANGFYEWRAEKDEPSKVPYYFTIKDQPFFAMAGLWAVWTDRDGGTLHSFAVLTRAADAFMRDYHDRMPLIVRPEAEATWLDHGLYRPEDLEPMLDPADSLSWEAQRVSTRVNRVAHDAPNCIEPVTAPPKTGWLF